jgi:hypothetical protein
MMSSSKMRSDPRPAVTRPAPGAACDTELAVTLEATILTAARPFICRFSSGEIAVVHVIGGTDEQACTEVGQAFVHCPSYTVEPGGFPTHGHAEQTFYLWVCQQSQPNEEKRNREMLRNTAGDQQEAAGYANQH